MAYVNVKDWSVDQVTEWLKGLDNIILPYTTSFLNNGVTGNQLLHLRADDLENLGVEIIGHQEIILEAVEHLRNFHYELDKENLQVMALRLLCTANSLYKELQYIEDTSKPLETQTMSGVHKIISTVKPLVYWLIRPPFLKDSEYTDIQIALLQHCFEMAYSAHRDRFSEWPVTSIMNICEKLIQVAENIIQDMKDPLILQPASLDLTTIRKKDQELGLFIFPSNHSIHQIAKYKHASPANQSHKIEIGDEIVQVNYQTVVGWQRKKVELLLQDSPPEVLLTLKKHPQHIKVYGPIYMKPYRLPSKKRATPYSRWNENLPSPRLLTINDLPQLPPPRPAVISPIQKLELETTSDSDTDPPDSPLDEPRTLYSLKSRPVLQRRNTITGATPTSTKPYPGIEQFIRMYKNEASMHSSSYHIQTNNFEDESTLLRDKSASCSHGLELTPRPTTVIGITQNRNVNRQGSIKNTGRDKPSARKKVIFEENKKVLKDFYNSNLLHEDKNNLRGDSLKITEEKSLSVNSLNSLSGTNEAINFIDEAEDLTDRSNMITKGTDDSQENKCVESVCGDNEKGVVKDNLLSSELKDVHVHNIIKKFDEKITIQESNLVINNAVRTKIQTRLLSEKSDPPPKPDPSTKPKNIKLQDNSDDVKEINPNQNEVCANEDKNFKVNKELEEDAKYELGIPLTEGENTCTPKDELQLANKIENILDVPPKPPPRTHVSDTYKPKYPANSPKPVIDTSRRRQVLARDANKENNQFLERKKTDTYDHKKLSRTNLNDSKISLNSAKFIPDVVPKSDVMESQTLKKFDSKVSTTSTTKSYKVDNSEIDSKNSMPVKGSGTIKVSPTNSIVRAMIYSSKGKNGKKKNTLTARKRKVSVHDVSPGDLEGYLYQRFRHRDGQKAYWDKLWFVLIGNRLYGFKSKDALKADVLIYLTGFTVCVATEVKSRSNAFKVYHTGTVFYFSAENMEATMAWIEMIKAATLHSDVSKPNDTILYSETDDSDSDKPKTPTEKSSEGIKKFGSLKKFASKKCTDSTHSGSTSLDRKWFFNKSTTVKNSIPVPTAQFRSYRKIPSSTMNIESVSTGNFTSHIPNFAARLEMQNFSCPQNISVPNLSLEPPRIEKIQGNLLASSKNKPINYSHASNPSLYNVCEFNPSFFNKGQHQTRENLAGFVTLEELMNRQTEEQKLDPRIQVNEIPLNDLIKPDVVYGEVPIRPKDKTCEKKKLLKHSPSFSDSKKSDTVSSSFCFGKRSVKKTQPESCDDNIATYPKSKHQDLKSNRSLPRAHKLLETYNVNSINDAKQYSDSCKSLTKLEDKSFLSTVDSNYADEFGTNNFSTHSMKRGSMEKLSKMETVNMNVKLKSAMQYTPLSLPLTDEKVKLNPKAFELNLDDKSHRSGKLKNFFHKQNEPKKEKTLLGSPKLHRAIFRKPNTPDSEWNQHVQLTSPTFATNEQDMEHNPCQVLQHADYPGLEYPPVFEPETYSLSDPQSSLTILRKQGKN